MTQKKPSMAIIGAGAIAGLFAKAGLEAGMDVSLCVRTPISSFTLLSGDKNFTLPVRIETRPERQAPADWVVLTTKVRDTVSAAPWLDSLTGPQSTLIAAQNGVDHEERLRPFAKSAPILPALIYVAIERIAPGIIRHHHGAACALPDLPAARRFRDLIHGNWLDIALEADFQSALWKKLMTNLIANSLTALTMRRIEVMREPEIQTLALGVLREAVLVGQAMGIAVRDADVEETLARFARPHETAGSSMYYDRLAGAPLEHEALTGTLLRLGRERNVPTPLNHAIYALLDAIDKAPRDARP